MLHIIYTLHFALILILQFLVQSILYQYLFAFGICAAVFMILFILTPILNNVKLGHFGILTLGVGFSTMAVMGGLWQLFQVYEWNQAVIPYLVYGISLLIQFIASKLQNKDTIMVGVSSIGIAIGVYVITIFFIKDTSIIPILAGGLIAQLIVTKHSLQLIRK